MMRKKRKETMDTSIFGDDELLVGRWGVIEDDCCLVDVHLPPFAKQVVNLLLVFELVIVIRLP